MQSDHLISEFVSCFCHASIFDRARSKKLSCGAGFASVGGSGGVCGGWTGIEAGDFVAQPAIDSIHASDTIR